MIKPIALDVIIMFGVCSGVPKEQIPAWVSALLVSAGKRDSNHLNAGVRWTPACRRLDGGSSLVSRVPSGVPRGGSY